MKVKQTRKVSFRVAPSVNEGLGLLAQCNETTLAEFIRGCVSYALTADKERLPPFIKESGLGAFPAVDDAKGWKEYLEEL